MSTIPEGASYDRRSGAAAAAFRLAAWQVNNPGQERCRSGFVSPEAAEKLELVNWQAGKLIGAWSL
jgi:hypothetical protein